MLKDKFILSIIVASVALLAAGIYLVSTTSSPQLDTANALVAANEKTHNWGEVNMNDGLVTKTFHLTNKGTDSLELANIKTSCACTKAVVNINGQKSPEFGMHTVSSWIGEVAPGEEAEIEVIFDPAYHGPQGVGAITREVTAETNDPNNSTLRFTLSANVINEEI